MDAVSSVSSNPFKDSFWLPMTFTEAVYLRGSIRRSMRLIKAGDERDYLNQLLVRLEQFMYDPAKYRNLPF